MSFTSALRGAHRNPLSYLPSCDVLASQKITERFSRNPEKPADEDVAERVFLTPEERIQVRYHCWDDRITASKREFLRRAEVDSKGNKIIMTPDMCISFEVCLGAVPGRAGWGGRGEGPGALCAAPPLGNTGMGMHASQPGSSSPLLGKIMSSHLGPLVSAAPLKIFPFPTKKDHPAGQHYSLLSLPPQAWTEPSPDPGTNTGVGEGPSPTTSAGLAFLI